MEQLAVYGWSDATPALLETLREVAGFEAVAVGDERPAALVRARAATGLPGFQHVREMARKAAFEMYEAEARRNAAFRRIYTDWKKFADASNQWLKVAEAPYANFLYYVK